MTIERNADGLIVRYGSSGARPTLVGGISYSGPFGEVVADVDKAVDFVANNGNVWDWLSSELKFAKEWVLNEVKAIIEEPSATLGDTLELGFINEDKSLVTSVGIINMTQPVGTTTTFGPLVIPADSMMGFRYLTTNPNDTTGKVKVVYTYTIV